jgi:hypothetical protein
VITTTEPAHYPDTDLQEAINQHDSVGDALRTIAAALATIPHLSNEIRHLSTRLASTLDDLRNLTAAARATLGAHADGEHDALYYLRDELYAQGQLPPRYRERP